MSFDSIERSREFGQPINLYKFVLGTENPKTDLCYTDSETPVVTTDRRFLPIAIQRDSVKSNGTLDKSTMSLEVIRDVAISELFRVSPPGYVVSLFIYQGHFGDDEFKHIWSGRVMQRTVNGMIATLSCQHIASSLKRPGLRRNCQKGCPLALYSKGVGLCNAKKVGKAVKVAEIVDTQRVRVTFTGSLGFTPAQFINGTIEWNLPDTGPDTRNIYSMALQSDGSYIIQLSGLTRVMKKNMALNIFPGCKHTMDDCGNTFKNVVNYGGQPWIPDENPVNKLSTFV